MSKIIIGIHGLGNKPPKRLLERWWKRSIHEGLRLIGHDRAFFNFHLISWSHFLHPKPLSLTVKDKDDPLYLKNPYVPAAPDAQPEQPSKKREEILDFIEKELDKLLLNDDLTVNYSMITDLIMKHFFEDLAIYFTTECEIGDDKNCTAKKAILDNTRREILQHRRKDIMLIGHSMGSIIAYDALFSLADEVEIDTLVTMGSPLGIPVIMSKIAAEREPQPKDGEKLTTPPNVTRHWHNFSDLSDKIAFNYDLGDDYDPNDRNVRAIDHTVVNNFEVNGEKNAHKSYGYLRTPEFATVVDEFLTQGRSAFWNRLEGTAQRALARFF